MKLSAILVIPLMMIAVSLAHAQVQPTEYGQLFTATAPAIPAQTQVVVPSKVDEAKAKMQAAIAPATFEDHENAVRAKAMAIQAQKEQAEKTMLAERASQANKPTIIVMQQPQPEPTLASTIFSLPGVLLRAFVR